jgi:uncharacterized protein YbjQ (UPF0145 family)
MNDGMVESWDGRGLPPVARQRIARAAADGVRTSLLPVNGAAGIETAGFDIVGEVLGTIVMQISWAGFGGCGWTPMAGIGGFGVGPGTVISGSRSARWAGYAPYVQAITGGRDTALNRMLTEAAALGADGVVGVTLTDQAMEGNKREFMALGTAVRSRGRERPARPFSTDLSGQDVAKLLLAGWVPAGIAYGISVAVRHDDWRTQSQVAVFAGNQEVTGYTELLTHVRADARREFARSAARHGGDSALMSSLHHHVWEYEPGENHRDHVAECVITGSAIARYHDSAFRPGRSLTILPLRSSR